MICFVGQKRLIIFKLFLTNYDLFVGQKRLIVFQLFFTNYDLFCRSKEIDWMPYFTQRMVDDFASHIRLYRRAMDKAKSVTVANKEGIYKLHYEKTCIRGF